MNYNCNCEPKQKLPHMIRSASCIPKYLSFQYKKGKRFIICSLYKYKNNPLSCDYKIIPIKKYRFSIGRLTFKFGKYI